MQLPQKYLESMKDLLGEEETNRYIESFGQERLYGLRVNTEKISVEDFLKISPFELTPIPYISNGFFYDEKELRIIQVLSLQDSSLKHIDDYYTLYKEYAKLSGLYRYPKICPLNKIIIGPKIEQKETLREYLINHLEKAGMNSVAVEFSKAPLA